MITVAAGDNVVRLLPPLIVTEEEIADAVQRIERACEQLAKKHRPAAAARSRRMSANGVRHFLDLIDISAGRPARDDRRRAAP